MITTGSGSVSNSAVCFSSDALRTEGWQPADTVARPPEPGAASAGTHRTSRQHPLRLAAACVSYRTNRGQEHRFES